MPKTVFKPSIHVGFVSDIESSKMTRSGLDGNTITILIWRWTWAHRSANEERIKDHDMVQTHGCLLT